MFLFFIILVASLFLVIKSANYAIKYSASLAEVFNLPKYVIGFVVVAIVSVLPEGFISITSAINGIPSFGLGTLFGSNIADMTLVISLVIFFSGKKLKIESHFIKNKLFYFGAMAVPIVFGLNGFYSRAEGILLIATGLVFYYLVLRKNIHSAKINREKFKVKHILFLILSVGGLLLGSDLTVEYGVYLAQGLSINPILIGMLIVGLGTTLPELIFSIKAAKKNCDDLALGDILGTVIADATIIVGIMALIKPFSFNTRLIYFTGFFMFAGMLLLFYFMKSDHAIKKKEALMLFVFYIIFVLTEFFVNR